MTDMFTVDPDGLRRKFANKPKSFLLFELFQNAVDENVTFVKMELHPIKGKALCDIRVEDDSPEGFKNLAHAFTLFADSSKLNNPEQRGIFNLGEKLVIANCTECSVSTTTGTVEFKNGERMVRPRKKRDRGSVFEGIIRMTRDEFTEVCQSVRLLIPPEGIDCTFNGETLESREVEGSFEASLRTTKGDEDNQIATTTRKTEVRLYEPVGDEEAYIYEMGIPVVALEGDDPWHIDVQQRVPLNMNRDNVTPAYKRALRALVLNEMRDRAEEEDLQSSWAQEALEDDRVDTESVEAVKIAKFGKNTVVRDPNDPESATRAVEAGYGLVPTTAFSKNVWGKVRSTGSVPSSSARFGTPKPFSDDPDAEPAEEVPEENWTEAQRRIVEYTRTVGGKLLDRRVSVSIVKKLNDNCVACYGSGQLTFGLKGIGGKPFFTRAMTTASGMAKLNDILIHEFAHQFSSSHLSDEFHRACTRLGAQMVKLALTEPELFEVNYED